MGEEKVQTTNSKETMKIGVVRRTIIRKDVPVQVRVSGPKGKPMYKIAEIDNLNQAARFSSSGEAVVTADSIETSKIF